MCGVLTTILLVSAGALGTIMVAFWVVSLALRDASIVDPIWGLAFAAVVWISFLLGDGSSERRLTLALLVSIWGLRLAGYLLARKRSERCEDPRYTALRERYAGRFPIVSLVVVFLFQGILVWVVALPVQVAATQPDRLGALDWAGVAVWAVGMIFEAVGDEQLRSFKADPANRGRVMDRGLWRYTRHPNYFGDFMVWWGIYLMALSTGGAWWTIIGPLVMSTLLIRVSGKRLLEAHLGKRPGYADYVARTSGFIPLPPRR
jgi:steroid 5-alpha reductase family enzyme